MAVTGQDDPYRVNGGQPAAASLRTEPPESLAVGRGNALWLGGTCALPGRTPSELRVRVGDDEARADLPFAPPPDRLTGSGWWEATVPLSPVARPKQARIELGVRFADGGEATYALGSLRLEPGPILPAPPSANGSTPAPDLVAICLATYDPPLELLRRQLDSIRAQTHRNWICIVSDDCSPLEKWRELVAIVGDDERFRLHRAHRRGGFYVNFERALALVPAEASFVALADQDDRWYPEKLETLVGALSEDDVLVHSDARVVNAGGELISPTFWPRGAPPHDRLESLLLASAVTGASCLFRRSVLEWALPFPPPVGTAYHDRWIALVAKALGGIAYVDGPLYDYVQHSGAVLGHAGVAGSCRPWAESRLRAARRRYAKLRERRFRPNWRSAHDEVLTRSVQEALVLRLRLGDRMTRCQRRATERLIGIRSSPVAQLRLLDRHIVRALRRSPGREGALLRGIAWRRIVRVRNRLHSLAAAMRRPIARLARPARSASLTALRALVRMRVPLPRATRRLAHVPASRRAEEALRARLTRGEPEGIVSGPTVSIVVPTRNGLDHLERLLPRLDQTRYRPFELIVVDNGSTDGTLGWLRSQRPSFDLDLIANAENPSFAAAINQGVRAASGELILLLNNDIEPAGTEWLGLMVATLRARDAACVGARLIYPRRPGLDNAGDETSPDLTLQHRGIHFAPDPGGIPRPRNLGAGEDPLSPAACSVSEVPAVTAACMLIEREALTEAGMLDEGYRYGTEDTELCLRLRERGRRIVYDGRAALFHHEFASQNVAGREAKRRNRAHNRRRFVDRWGARLHREVLADRLCGERRLSQAPLRIGITVTRDSERAGHGDYHTARELGGELGALGFEVAYLEAYRNRWRRDVGSVDIVISLLDSFPLHDVPAGVVSVAWVRNWTERWVERPWFDDYDIVFASSRRSCEIIAERSSQTAKLMPLATNPARFAPAGVEPRLAADVMFAGNHWGVGRDVERALPGLAGEFAVKAYGRGWDAVAGMDDCHAGRLDYERLPAAYSSARVVVDDSAAHTRPYGAVNSRVFDALACGTLVASNDAEGVRELFGEEFPVWHDAASLRDHVLAARADPGRAARLVERYRERVLAEHTYAHRARQVRSALLDWCESTRFGICIGVPRRELVESWGDYHYARALQRQLERRGHPTRVHLLTDWEREHPARDDVCLHLFGLSELEPREGQVSVIWNISHPELVTPELLDGYDLALVASPGFADEVAALTATPVHVLRQATDPERFRPDPGGVPYELLFVGNSRKVRRPLVAEAARSGYELTLYGGGWTPELVNGACVAGETVPNGELPGHYSAAAIVLNDHWDDMRRRGFLSNRIYDALACGSCVVSDHVEGIDEEFDGAVVTAAPGEDLHAAIDRLMRNPAERAERAVRGRRAVLERHTFDHRIDELLTHVEPLLAERPRRLVPRASGGLFSDTENKPPGLVSDGPRLRPPGPRVARFARSVPRSPRSSP